MFNLISNGYVIEPRNLINRLIGRKNFTEIRPVFMIYFYIILTFNSFTSVLIYSWLTLGIKYGLFGDDPEFIFWLSKVKFSAIGYTFLCSTQPLIEALMISVKLRLVSFLISTVCYMFLIPAAYILGIYFELGVYGVCVMQTYHFFSRSWCTFAYIGETGLKET